MFLSLEKTTNNNHTIAQIKVSMLFYCFLANGKIEEKENKIKLKAEVLNPDLMLRLGLAKQNFMII